MLSSDLIDNIAELIEAIFPDYPFSTHYRSESKTLARPGCVLEQDLIGLSVESEPMGSGNFACPCRGDIADLYVLLDNLFQL